MVKVGGLCKFFAEAFLFLKNFKFYVDFVIKL